MSDYKSKKYFIKTFGCQANIADSDNLAGILEVLGFEELLVPKFKTEVEEIRYVVSESDIFLINTCSVRQKSEDKVYGLGKSIKGINKKAFIILAGCMVGSVTGERIRFDEEILKKKTPWVDLYINPSQVFLLPDILKEKGLVESSPQRIEKKPVAESKTPEKKHAYINISNGCDNFCTYCVVPYARGGEISRSRDDILRDIKRMIVKGITEITLCAQNVNSWGLNHDEKFKIRSGSMDKLPFAGLLREIHSMEGIEKIDFLSSNPFDFTKDLIDVLKLPKISNYIHIAIQSGNNEVLRRMNRRHTVEEFKNLVSEIKKIRPDIELGTDIIVGFPGETREQFFDTVKLFEQVKFNVAFISMYSPRKGTNAEKFMSDNVSREEKKWRLAYLTKVWKGSKEKLLNN